MYIIILGTYLIYNLYIFLNYNLIIGFYYVAVIQ